jgi:hypothetical protein
MRRACQQLNRPGFTGDLSFISRDHIEYVALNRPGFVGDHQIK